MAARLQEFYRKEVVPALMKQLGVANPMAVPRITKITLNMGVGEALADKKVLESAMADLAKISGPEARAVQGARSRSRASRCATAFAIGCKVTLRKRAHVRVPGSAHQRRDAAYPRLPRRVARARSTAAAITTWASKSRSFFRRSITTRSTRSAASTSRSRRRRATDDAGRALLEAFKFPLRGDR